MKHVFNYKHILKYAVSFGLLCFFAMQVDWKDFWSHIKHISPFIFVGALILIIVQIIFLNMRWHALLNAENRNIPFLVSSLINIAGYFANILFITAIGGVVAKSGLAIRQGIPVMTSIFITFLDRFLTLGALIVFCALSLPFLYHVLDHNLSWTLALIISCTTCIVLGALLLLRSGVMRDYIIQSRKRSRWVLVLRRYMEDYALMGRTFVMSLIAQACFFGSVYILSLGIQTSQPINVVEFLALMPVMALISSLPISFGGWGVREGAFIYGLGLIGYTMEGAFLLSIQVGVVTMIAPFFVALPYLSRQSMRQYFKTFIQKHT